MKITSVNVRKIEKENSRIRGIASVVLDECFAVHGIRIIETNYLPSTNITAENAPGQTTGSNQAANVYVGDFSNTAALVMQKGAIGTITRKGVTVECTWLPTELTWLLTARNLQGHGILDPRKAVEIRDEAAA